MKGQFDRTGPSCLDRGPKIVVGQTESDAHQEHLIWHLIPYICSTTGNFLRGRPTRPQALTRLSIIDTSSSSVRRRGLVARPTHQEVIALVPLVLQVSILAPDAAGVDDAACSCGIESANVREVIDRVEVSSIINHRGIIKRTDVAVVVGAVEA
jgi:hypothetical protein